MPWAKLDDAMGEHRKIKRALRKNRSAIALHFLGILHCSRYLTDGFVEDEYIEEVLPARERKAALDALVEQGLWAQTRGGFTIHDYLDHNPTAVEVEANRGVDRFRKELTRDHKLIAAIRKRDGDTCRYCGVTVDWKDRRSNVGGTYDHVIPVSQGGQNTFDNVVVACRGCNQRKGPRTPAEAGMDLAGSSPRPSPGPESSSPNLAQTSDPRPVPSRPVPETAGGSPAVGGRAGAVERATPLSINEERQTLADDIVGILQRGVDGLTTDERCKQPSRAAVLSVLADTPRDVAVAAAIDARSIAQAQNRAPNIVALFAQRLSSKEAA